MEMASPELASALLVGLYLVSLAQWDGNKKEGHGVRDGDQSLSPCRAGKPDVSPPSTFLLTEGMATLCGGPDSNEKLFCVVIP